MIVGHLWYSTPSATVLMEVNDTGAIIGGPGYIRKWALGKLCRPLFDASMRPPADGIQGNDHNTYSVWMPWSGEVYGDD